jgi:hypothetical protein
MGDPRGYSRIYGAIFLDQVVVMKMLAGEEAYERARQSLSEEMQRELAELLPISWIGNFTCNELMARVARELGRDTDDFVREVVRVGVEKTLITLWRVLLRFTTDNALVTRTPLLYSKTYDRGKLVAVIDEPGRARITLSEYPDPPHLELLCLATGIDTVLTCAGRKGVSTRWERTADGATLTATWRP